MKPSEKRQQSGSEGEQSDKQEPPAGARGKRKAIRRANKGGDKAGGGEEGGGQKSPRDGTGSAGQNQSADEGGGESSEKGAGNNSPNAGRMQRPTIRLVSRAERPPAAAASSETAKVQSPVASGTEARRRTRKQQPDGGEDATDSPGTGADGEPVSRDGSRAQNQKQGETSEHANQRGGTSHGQWR